MVLVSSHDARLYIQSVIKYVLKFFCVEQNYTVVCLYCLYVTCL